MDSLATFLKQKKNAPQGNRPWAWLFDLHRDSSNVSRYTGHDTDITFNGQTYSQKAIEYQPPSSDAAGTIALSGVVIEDADGTEMAYLMNDKYRSRYFSAQLVNIEDLSDETYRVLFRGKIMTAGWAKHRVALRVGLPDMRKTMVPCLPLFSWRCQHRWKDHRCQYAGSVTTPCDLLYETCRDVMDNVANFWGAPGMPRFRA